MATVQIENVVVPAEFTAYTVANSVERTAFFESGVAVRNDEISAQLSAGADQFTIPFWLDLEDDEANITNDDPDDEAEPNRIGTGRQVVRKSFLHNSWSAMNLASELSGDDAITRIRDRVTAYWGRQWQRRLISTLGGILLDNVANDGGDMVLDVSAESGVDGDFGAVPVIRAAATLGDAMEQLRAIAMHSTIYTAALENDLIEFTPQSQGKPIRTFRGLQVVVDDGLPVDEGTYTSVLFGLGALGFGASEPRVGPGTEIERKPGSGNGGGQTILHSRMNMAGHPFGFKWTEANVVAESPSIAELAIAANWDRVLARKAVPLAFLISRAGDIAPST